MIRMYPYPLSHLKNPSSYKPSSSNTIASNAIDGLINTYCNTHCLQRRMNFLKRKEISLCSKEKELIPIQIEGRKKVEGKHMMHRSMMFKYLQQFLFSSSIS